MAIYLIPDLSTAAPMRVCGWCDLQLAPGTLPASHGICPTCYDRLNAALQPFLFDELEAIVHPSVVSGGGR